MPASAHGRLKTWVIVAAVVACLALLAFASTYSPLFAADTVRVEGVDHLTARQVRRIAKIDSGVNVFRLDTGRAEQRLERNAWVAEARVTTQLPSGVTIVVHERTPAATAVTDAAGGRSLVAGDGTILAAAQGPVSLPMVQSADGATVPDDAQRALGATVAGSLPASIVAEVETVTVGDDGSVAVALSSGELVSYGDGTALSAKGQALRAVLLWAEREGVRFVSIDVRTPGAPTASLTGGATVSPRL
jgi:cell division protein FtsQ